MAENENTEVVAFLYDIVGNAPFGITTIALDGTLSMVNDQACEILDQKASPNTFIDSPYSDLFGFSALFVKKIEHGLQKSRQAFDLDDIEVADKFISLKTRATLKGYLVIITDTTSERRAKDVLTRSKAALELQIAERTKSLEAVLVQQRSIVESMVDGLIVINAMGTIEAVNPAAELLFGYAAIDIIGQNIKRLMPDPYAGEHDGYLRHYLETGERKIIGIGREVEGLRKDGSTFPLDLSVNPMEVDGVKYFLGGVKDITERREKDLQLQRTNAELEQFAYVASHDLQEPLRMVASYLQLLEKKYSSALDEQANKYIYFAVDGATRMRTLINDLLAFSRLGRDEVAIEKVSVESLLVDFKNDFTVVMEDSQTTISHKPLPDVYGDARMIRSLFQNIISNAIKYRGEAAPRIQVSAKRQGQFWAFSISDNGIGIKPQFFEKIFGVFQRLHGRGEYEGTGIGLAVCKKIIECHQGEISLESKPGEGSTFHFTLPAVEIAAP